MVSNNDCGYPYLAKYCMIYFSGIVAEDNAWGYPCLAKYCMIYFSGIVARNNACWCVCCLPGCLSPDCVPVGLGPLFQKTKEKLTKFVGTNYCFLTQCLQASVTALKDSERMIRIWNVTSFYSTSLEPLVLWLATANLLSNLYLFQPIVSFKA